MNRSSRWIIGLVVTLAAPCFLWQQVAAAGLTTEVYGQGGNDSMADSGFESAGFYKTITQRFGMGDDPDDVIRTTFSANARAAVGSLGVDIYGLVDSTGAKAHGDGVSEYALAKATDTLTIVAPGLDGTAGAISFDILVEGGFSGSYSPSTARNDPHFNVLWLYEIYTQDPGTGNYLDSTALGSSVNREGLASEPLALDTLRSESLTPLDFVYGRPFVLESRFYLTGNLQVPWESFSFFSAAYSNTAALQGIAAVRDANGNLVSNFSISAASGADYTQPFSAPVPEPSSIVLLALGAAALVLSTRRRRPGRDLL